MRFKDIIQAAIHSIDTKLSFLNDTVGSIEQDVDAILTNVYDLPKKITNIKSILEGRVCEENIYLQRMNDFLMQIISKKYDKGTIIFYDERDPRQVTVVRDGKKVDMDKATELSFYWEPGAFPTLEITR